MYKLLTTTKPFCKLPKATKPKKIVAADQLRDKSVSAFTRQTSVFELSDNDNELLAYKSLATILKTYKGLQSWNFEEESNGIDNLLTDLNNAKYAHSIALLNMNNLVARIASTNQTFKTLFAGKTQELAGKEIFDTKKLRKDLSIIYNDMIQYLQYLQTLWYFSFFSSLSSLVDFFSQL